MLFKYPESNIKGHKQLSEMDNSELLEICKNINILKVNEILDGIDCKFGIDENEDVFLTVESYDDIDAAKSFVKGNASIITALEEIYDNYGPVKMECTMFPTFSHTGDDKGNVTYETLSYHRNKFGTHGAFVINEVDSWSGDKKDYVTAMPDVSSNISDRLQESDNSKWRMYSEKNTTIFLEGINVDLSEFDDIFINEQKYLSAQNVLNNPEGSSHRNILETMLNKVRPIVESGLSNSVNNSRSSFGNLSDKSRIKGAILNLGESSFKIDNTAFSKMRERKFASREKIKETIEQNEVNFFNEVFNFNIKSGDDLDRVLEKTANNFRSNKIGESRINQYLSNVVKELNDSYIFEEKNMRTTVDKALMNSLSSIVEMKRLSSSEITDIDTKNKIKKSIELAEKRHNFILKNSRSKSYIGESYNNHILKLSLLPRLESITEQITENLDEDGYVRNNAVTPEKVILFLNKSQPWTKTEDAMIYEAKQHLKEHGADKVYIVIDGYDEPEPMATSRHDNFNDFRNNPASFKLRHKVVESIYEEDQYVEVCPIGVKDNSVNNIIESVFLRENKQIVGVVTPTNSMGKYGTRWNDFNSEKWQENVCRDIPIEMSENGMKMIGVSDVGINQEKSRKLVVEVGFDTWRDVVCPSGISEKAMKSYNDLYNEMYQNYVSINNEEYRGQLKNLFGG